MNKEDLTGIVNYWCLQAETANTTNRNFECHNRCAEALAQIALIEMQSTDK